MIKADLHIHTSASDGLLTPQEVVQLAHEQGLNIIAITDHDTLDGIEAAMQAAKQYGIKVIPGVELSAEHEPEIHILGYGMDLQNPKLTALLNQTREQRRMRDEVMLKQLQERGLAVTREMVEQQARGGVVGRPHFARALIEIGAAQTMAEAFEKYLLPGGAGYVSRMRPSAHACISAIRAAEGMAVLAHPRLLNMLPFELERLVEMLAQKGLQGIEAYSPGNRPGETRRFERLAERYRLFVTGGSDYHGPSRPLCGLGGVPGWPQGAVPPFAAQICDDMQSSSPSC